MSRHRTFSIRTAVAAIAAGALLASACTGAKKQAAVKSTSGPTTTLAPEETSTTAAGPATPGATATTAKTGATKSATPKAKPGAKTAAPRGAAVDPTAAAIAAGYAPATLFTDKENTIGITQDSITLCAHAALTYAKAFNTDTKDLDVYWKALNAEQGGIYGRKVTITYEDDAYDPAKAVAAATACQAKNPFMLLGGIGFDQIPAVRNWAEQNHMLYIHHTATTKGSEGKQYSFTELPSVEKMGEMFAELVAKKYPGKKVGIIERDSPNWSPGVEAFKAIAASKGIKIVADNKVAASKANYTQDILDMQSAGAEVVWGWENALAGTEMIKQAKAQAYSPAWVLFPFNLTSQTLGDDALNPKISGVAMYTAYSYGDYTGPFAGYADDMKEFERQYKQYDSGVDLTSVAGDLLFLNWTAMKVLHQQLLACGPDCTRNRMLDTLHGYKKRDSSSACEIDFSRGNEHLGGYAVNVMETYKNQDGKVNWRNTDFCVEKL